MNDTQVWTKAMFGQHARQVAFNVVLQDGDGEGRCMIIGNTTFGKEMRFGSKLPHVLLLCDAVIRPHLVIESNHLIGCGASGILTSSSMAGTEEWIRHGNVLLNNLPSKYP
jgi:hypothetical protein